MRHTCFAYWLMAFQFLIPAAEAQEVLPFPPTPSASTPGISMQSSTYQPRVEPNRLPKDVPNILIVLIDDIGPGTASTFGGEIQTPTMDRIVKEGIAYNRFHTTAMCSPTRGALLTGRNHHRIGAGQIAEFANDWDGYAGVQPKSCAMIPEVLKQYGYSTSAFGKWHNTPANQTTAAGPFDHWPTGYGFEYFYGFLAGEDSQFHPNLVRNTTIVEHPQTSGGNDYYHLTEDLADDAIRWLENHKAFRSDKPFFMYFATGATHGPHQVPKKWADKYKGKFDDGWDNYRERVFKRAKERGWIPQNAELTPRPETLASWESIPEDQKPFQRRLMEVFAGFAEHTDHHVGRLIDRVDELGYKDNTVVFYIWGDNGSSAEGQNGTIAELLAQNGIPSTIEQHLKALEPLGGLDALGSAKTDNMFHAAWAWAGSTPYRSTKLVAAHFGGTRNPMAVRWPKKLKPDPDPRTQFTHCTDIVPTIYELIGITPPQVLNGIPQKSFDGTSFAYTFDDPKAKDRKRTQYFEIMGSRAIYHEGWMACAFGPRTPWVPGASPTLATWTPDDDQWELYNLEKDWSQAHDLAGKHPEKLDELKELFLVEAAKNKVLPIGGGLWVFLHPQYRVAPPYQEWQFSGSTHRMPEFTAPRLGTLPSVVTLDAEIPANANGVLYSLGGFAGGLSCYLQDGVLCYEYNLFLLQRTPIRGKVKLPEGKTTIEVETVFAGTIPKIGGPLRVTLKVNGEQVAQGTVPTSIGFGFTANDSFDVGMDLASPVSENYYDLAPFQFNGKIHKVQVKYLK